MSRFTSLATLSLALALLIPSSSAAGAGRFPCSDVNGNGDPSICANLDAATEPRGSECVADAINGGWFCGESFNTLSRDLSAAADLALSLVLQDTSVPGTLAWFDGEERRR